MRRIKIRRILWTLAALIALLFAAGIVLHKHAEPQIIGNLSKEDVSQISKIAMKDEREFSWSNMKFHFKQREVREFVRWAFYYPTLKVVRMERSPDGIVSIAIGTGTNDVKLYSGAKNEKGVWRNYTTMEIIYR